MTTRTRITALLLADVNQDGLRNAQDLQRLYEQLTGTARNKRFRNAEQKFRYAVSAALTEYGKNR